MNTNVAEMEVDPRKKFQLTLKDRGVKQTWLSEKTGISKEHISNILCGRVLLTEENRRKINEVLSTDF